MSVIRAFRSFGISKLAKKKPSTQGGEPLGHSAQRSKGAGASRQIGTRNFPLDTGRSYAYCSILGWVEDSDV